MGGCGLKKGVVHGKTNDEGTWVATEEVDIGALFHTWYAALGIDSKKKQYYNAGQPLPLAHDDMKKVAEILA
jgi:hypothetical protein